jgi:hypothetical protein
MVRSNGAQTRGWRVRLGYPELARGQVHLEGLIERNLEDLAIFDNEIERAKD